MALAVSSSGFRIEYATNAVHKSSANRQALGTASFGIMQGLKWTPLGEPTMDTLRAWPAIGKPLGRSRYPEGRIRRAATDAGGIARVS